MSAILRLFSALTTITRSLANNVPLALVSLALATTLWVAVTNEENPTLRREFPLDVPVESINTPRSVTVTGLQPSRVRVTLIGPKDTISAVRPQDLTARVDLSGAGAAGANATTYTAPVEVSVKQHGVRTDISPPTAQVTLEPIVKRSVPVRVNRVETLPLGFELTDPLTAQPSEVTVIGSKENVNAVDAAVANVKLSGLTVSVNQSLPLDPQDSAGHSIRVTVDPSTTTVSVKLRQVLFTRQILVDPRLHGRPAPGYAVVSSRADPTTVNVIGPVDVLRQIATASTADVDIEGATSDVIRTVALQLPNGASVSDAKSNVVVTVSIQPQRAPGSMGVVPRLVGMQAGLTAALQTPVVQVNLTGPAPTLLHLTPADVTAVVDLTGLGPGAYQLAAKVSAPAGVQVDSVLPDRISVLIAPAGGPR